jgi:Protein of unknown function (DUF3105)
MSHRRDQKERLRREREEREAAAQAAQQRKRLFGVVGAVAMAVVAIAIVVILSGGGGSDDTQSAGNNFPEGGSIPEQKVFDLDQAAAAAGCELKSNKATSREHLTDPNQKVNYPQNPPTSGKHFQVPAEDGLYNGAPPPDTALVHSLEHGRVIIWAKPSLPVEAREQLRALFDEGNYQLIVVRRANMPYAVAATAWNHDPTPNGTGRLMGCPKWDDGVIDALRAFRDEHLSNGPEDIP